ncbi:unnamed protein product [Arctogadus glacialis]
MNLSTSTSTHLTGFAYPSVGDSCSRDGKVTFLEALRRHEENGTLPYVLQGEGLPQQSLHCAVRQTPFTRGAVASVAGVNPQAAACQQPSGGLTTYWRVEAEVVFRLSLSPSIQRIHQDSFSTPLSQRVSVDPAPPAAQTTTGLTAGRRR